MNLSRLINNTIYDRIFHLANNVFKLTSLSDYWFKVCFCWWFHSWHEKLDVTSALYVEIHNRMDQVKRSNFKEQLFEEIQILRHHFTS